jgi:hypothetical protein
MNKSNIAQGQMILYFDHNIMTAPKVWVKVSDNDTDNEPSLFVVNDAVVRYCIDKNNLPSITEQWYISDRYYGKMVREGKFVPVDDLAQCDRICEELGWPNYLMDLGF